MQKTVLIIGGAGFIGSHVVDLVLAEGNTVAVLDNLSSGSRKNVNPAATFYEGDMLDADFVRKVLTELHPDVVCHFAAQVSVANSLVDPVEDARLNMLGTLSVLESMRIVVPKAKIIYAASAAMYGMPAELPVLETTPSLSLSPYGLSKYTGEQYVWLYNRLHNTPATVLRFSNVYGPRQSVEGEAGVCAIFCQRMLSGGSVKIYGDGSQLRDYIAVGDVARATLAALEKGDGEPYNISTNTKTSVCELFALLKELSGYEHDPIFAEERAGEIKESRMSADKAARELGWSAGTSLRDGLATTVAWYRESAADGATQS